MPLAGAFSLFHMAIASYGIQVIQKDFIATNFEPLNRIKALPIKKKLGFYIFLFIYFYIWTRCFLYLLACSILLFEGLPCCFVHSSTKSFEAYLGTGSRYLRRPMGIFQLVLDEKQQTKRDVAAKWTWFYHRLCRDAEKVVRDTVQLVAAAGTVFVTIWQYRQYNG